MNSPRLSATIRRTVEWSDTDASGHHHNAFIIRLIEAAERELMEANGAELVWAEGTPRVRHEIDYTAPLYFGQPVTATIELQRLGRASVTYGFEVWGEEHTGRPRRRAASGTVVAAHVPRGAERAAPWPDAFRAAFGAGTPGQPV